MLGQSTVNLKKTQWGTQVKTKKLPSQRTLSVSAFIIIHCYIKGRVAVVYLGGGDSEDPFTLASLLNLAAADITAEFVKFAAESSPLKKKTFSFMISIQL